MPIEIADPQAEIERIVAFLTQVTKNAGSKTLLIAVSGGIDSALSLSLAVKALGAENVHAVMLPYKDQSTEDSQTIIAWNKLPEQNTHIINIENIVDAAATTLNADSDLRKGNIMARSRMIVVYDLAKQLSALVCGTENKSEKYLGYFTRFGDEASDIEPIQHLYKTQVRQLAEYLQLPNVFLEKAPSAGLWQDQTDEQELGFSYQQADLALSHLIDGEELNVDQSILQKVQQRVESQHFKHEVPYKL